MTTEQFEIKQSLMPTQELIDKIESNLSKLCKTGGKSLSMSVPPSVNDFDMLVCELIKRVKQLR